MTATKWSTSPTNMGTSWRSGSRAKMRCWARRTRAKSIACSDSKVSLRPRVLLQTRFRLPFNGPFPSQGLALPVRPQTANTTPSSPKTHQHGNLDNRALPDRPASVQSSVPTRAATVCRKDIGNAVAQSSPRKRNKAVGHHPPVPEITVPSKSSPVLQCELSAFRIDHLMNLQRALCLGGGVKGRLANHVSSCFLSNLDPFLTNLLVTGYTIPFVSPVLPYSFPNNCSAFKFRHFVDQEIRDLLQKRLIAELSSAFFVNPLSVADNSSKLRLILDCSHLNSHIAKYRFRLEGLSLAIKMFHKSCFMMKLDLKSGYHHVDIHPLHQQYLAFRWNSRFFAFTVLPFGLSSGPYVFTKIMKPFIKRWRTAGANVLIYIDDLIMFAPDLPTFCRFREMILNDLTAAGFVLNTEKSVVSPTQNVSFLGFLFNSHTYEICIPSNKVENVTCILSRCFRTQPFLTPRNALKCAGLIISLKFVVGNLTLIHTRNLYRFVGKCGEWDIPVFADSSVWADIKFWIDGLKKYAVRKLNPPYASLVPVHVSSDASATGGGCIFTFPLTCQHTHLEWTANQTEKSSTWRELYVVLHGLLSLDSKLRNSRVVWQCDNQAVPFIISRGSMQVELHDMSVRIFVFCHKYNVRLLPQWIPRIYNTDADTLSRIRDWDDWQITSSLFRCLQAFSGFRATIDLFANSFNAKCSRFYSRFWCPGACNVDAFAQDWSQEFAWAVPPPHLIYDCLQKFSVEECHMLLLVPFWPSSAFWPLLCSPAIHQHVVMTCKIPHAYRFLLPGRQKQCCFLCPQYDSSFLCVVLCRSCMGVCQFSKFAAANRNTPFVRVLGPKACAKAS